MVKACSLQTVCHTPTKEFHMYVCMYVFACICIYLIYPIKLYFTITYHLSILYKKLLSKNSCPEHTFSFHRSMALLMLLHLLIYPSSQLKKFFRNQVSATSPLIFFRNQYLVSLGSPKNIFPLLQHSSHCVEITSMLVSYQNLSFSRHAICLTILKTRI